MGKKLCVRNLPFSSTEDQIKSHFGAYGTVNSVKLITDQATGRSRGFAFVEMSTPDEANAAMAGLHETELGGRQLIVNEAKDKPRAGGGDKPRGGGGYRREDRYDR